MRLHSLQIKGFRKVVNSLIFFSDATFFIGENNACKSTVLNAIKCLLTASKELSADDYTHQQKGEVKQRIVEEVEFIAEFRNLPEEAKNWRGFKGRISNYKTEEDSKETGLAIVYKKVFPFGDKCEYYVLSRKRSKKEEFLKAKKYQDLISAGLSANALEGLAEDLSKNCKDEVLEQIDEIWNIDEKEEEWIQNPGGFATIFLSKLPEFLLIPAQDKADEIAKGTGTLTNILTSLFSDVRDNSENFKEAQKHLLALEKEFDPSDPTKELGKMMTQLNNILGGVFPDSKIHAAANLSDINKVLSPQFAISMQSNVSTPVGYQGTGSIRAAVFALLRFKAQRERSQRKDGHLKPIIIGFEEPEIYLHPQAAYQMKEVIYELAQEHINQIVCTTHSPYMIDLGKSNVTQMLNHCHKVKAILQKEGEEIEVETIRVNPFNTSQAFKNLIDNDRDHVKMILKIDDTAAKVFFSSKILVVEGDTEEIVLKQTIALLPDEQRKLINSTWQIIKARGKAAIISLVKYLTAMDLHPVVIHDKDEVEGATKFNAPIAEALNDNNRLFILENCIEDVLGYKEPSHDKPHKAYVETRKWEKWEDIPEAWRNIVHKIFVSNISSLKESEAANKIEAKAANSTKPIS